MYLFIDTYFNRKMILKYNPTEKNKRILIYSSELNICSCYEFSRKKFYFYSHPPLLKSIHMTERIITKIYVLVYCIILKLIVYFSTFMKIEIFCIVLIMKRSTCIIT